MITVLTLVFNKYLHEPFQNFTEKYLLARGLFKLMDNFDPKDLQEVEKIRDEVHEKCKLSLYKLDRNINDSKKEFSICSNQLIFKDKNGKEITLNEDDIQYYLCCAIERVHEIIMKNIKNYQLEQPVNFGLDTQNSDLKELLKV